MFQLVKIVQKTQVPSLTHNVNIIRKTAYFPNKGLTVQSQC